jgi:hypothetical protein
MAVFHWVDKIWLTKTLCAFSSCRRWGGRGQPRRDWPEQHCRGRPPHSRQGHQLGRGCQERPRRRGGGGWWGLWGRRRWGWEDGWGLDFEIPKPLPSLSSPFPRPFLALFPHLFSLGETVMGSRCICFPSWSGMSFGPWKRIRFCQLPAFDTSSHQIRSGKPWSQALRFGSSALVVLFRTPYNSIQVTIGMRNMTV